MLRIYPLGLECNITLDKAAEEEAEADNIYARVFSEGIKIKTKYNVFNVVHFVYVWYFIDCVSFIDCFYLFKSKLQNCITSLHTKL